MKDTTRCLCLDTFLGTGRLNLLMELAVCYNGCIGPFNKHNEGDKHAPKKLKQITSFSGTSDKSISFEKIS